MILNRNLEFFSAIGKISDSSVIYAMDNFIKSNGSFESNRSFYCNKKFQLKINVFGKRILPLPVP
jgi:hypothetical protein